MTRTEAAHSVRERWERLGIGTPEEFPRVFSSDVDNLLEELSSTGNILDVAGQGRGIAPSTESITVGNEGVRGFTGDRAEQNGSTREHPVKWTRPQERGISDSQILDRHGDDRFADNILRALEGLPQNGDAEEEEAAAEEGALIEASGYLDPVYERNGR